jgi:RNA polymerase sigma factor (sigma-70 family)
MGSWVAEPADAGSSLELVKRACAGDREAENEVCRRYLPRLHRWVRGRLPAAARLHVEAADVVQDVLVRAIRTFPHFEVRHEHAFDAYLRTILANKLLDLGRAARRRPPQLPLDAATEPPSRGPSPFQLTLAAERRTLYERAKARLSAVDRELLLARLELGCDYHEMVTRLGRSNANALRVSTRRAIVRLGAVMAHDAVGPDVLRSGAWRSRAVPAGG